MAWIATKDPREDETLARLVQYRMRTHGYWPNVLNAMSLKPDVLERPMAFQDRLTFGGSSLGRRWEELISFHVSALNRCEY
ncbi:MAG: hypothetical protein HYY85_00955 [Deltaproteobacteria bacterium]|nr:hypothetical protein [Deltaproteobacteria bacterium]